MRRNSSLLWSTTALATFAFAASPAAAQDQSVTPPNPAATAQQNPAQPAQNADAPTNAASANGNGTDTGSIVVTGLRRSMQSARNLKRNSDQVVDAVVAEDIGKLPDITVSDTAARIPGVQVERSGGEANRVLIRGLDQEYYTTTYNSRELFTAETRSVALQDFPAGAVAAIEVFKTSTANLIEPGISGLVNVRSRRPFDFKGAEISGSVWGIHPNQSRDNSINGNLLLSDRWRAGDGEFGALINVSYTRIHYKDSIRRNGFWIADLAGGRSPDYPEIHYNEGNRWRPSVNGALQYRNGDLQLYAEGLWQGYRERQLDSMWAQPLWGGGSYSNLVFRPGTNEIVSGTVTTPGACCGVDSRAWGFKGSTHRETNTYQFAAGGSYDAGPLQVTADIAHTYSHFQLRTESTDMQLATDNYTVNWYDGYPNSDKGPTFQVVGLDPTNPANYQYRGFYEDYHDPIGKDWQGRLDFEYTPAAVDFIPKIQWGVRYVDRDASDRGGDFYWNARGLQVPISQVPLDYALIPTAFRGDPNPPFPTSWFAPTYNSVWDNLTAFRQFNINLLGYGSVNGPPINPARTYSINEKSLAGYGQLNFRFESGPTSFTGILGLRAVHTRDNIQGTITELAGPTPLDITTHHTDWLPNANLNVRFGPQWQLRLAATKTRTNPEFSDLNPSPNIGPPVICNPATTCIRSGSAGNPYLRPFKSTNYDASLEYYFSPTGFASVGVFHRDVKGFIATEATSYPDPTAPNVLIQLNVPVNTNRGKITGFEAQIRTFFDWDWMPSFGRSFGIDANVTRIKANAEFDILNGLAINAPFEGVSKWSYNLTGMYERGPLSVRLSYNRRTSYAEGGFANNGNFTLQGFAHPSPRLDLSTSYNLTDHFTLFADWTNIFPHPFHSDIVRRNYNTTAGTLTSTEVFPMVVRFEETVLAGGIRFNFSGAEHAAAPPPAYVPPPPPPPPAYVPPAPPPPPPPPPPTTSGQRG